MNEIEGASRQFNTTNNIVDFKVADVDQSDDQFKFRNSLISNQNSKSLLVPALKTHLVKTLDAKAPGRHLVNPKSRQ